tara:strand:- start:1738 stop:1887 length:150 start_codon:yes stop_codon:yes gene_type:complete
MTYGSILQETCCAEACGRKVNLANGWKIVVEPKKLTVLICTACHYVRER